MEKQSQCDRVLAFIRQHGSINTFQANEVLRPRVTRLAARIYDLEQRGFRFKHDQRQQRLPDGAVIKWVEYRLDGRLF